MSESLALNRRRSKIKDLLLVFGLALICFVPLWGFVVFAPRFILYFPASLLVLLASIGLVPSADGDEAMIATAALFVWLLFFGISAAIIMSNNSTVVRRLFIVLIILLILNLVGWYYEFFSRIN